MLRWSRALLIVCCASLLPLGAVASAAISPKILVTPNISRPVELSFDAPSLPEGGYYYAIIVLEPYGHYTRQYAPPCSLSSDMQRTAYGYPRAGRVSLTLAPAASHTGAWCLGGSYQGAIYAVPHPPPCEATYPCRSEPYEPPSPCWSLEGRQVCGVVAQPQGWAYPQGLPRPISKGARAVGWFVVRFRSHRR